MNITGLWQQREGNLRGCRPVGNGQTFCEEIVCYQIIFSARPGLLTSSVEAWDRWQRGAAADLRSAAKTGRGSGGSSIPWLISREEETMTATRKISKNSLLTNLLSPLPMRLENYIIVQQAGNHLLSIIFYQIVEIRSFAIRIS